MKIMASDVRFNAAQHEQTTERYARQSDTSNRETDADASAVMSQVDLSYSARMRAEDRTHVDAQSSVSHGYDRATFNKTQATHSVTQTVVGIDASVLNVAINDNSPSLLEPSQSGVYKNIEQLNISEPEQSPARVEIAEQYHFTQQQTLHVGTQGKVTTQDGREIDFMLKLEMSRDFSLEESIRIQSTERAVMDPLVINLSGGAASLTSHSFSFDLNADGKKEDISFVGSGSGFLAIDNNNDGRINDGSELFGTTGKDGFSDLAQYDNDNNMWIDENDEIFSKLKVWTKDSEGNDQLISLKAAGVGAIYLGSAAASFDLRDSENNLLGQVKRSGVFLTERGEVASIQELDIAVHEQDTTSVTHSGNVELQLADWEPEESAQDNPFINLNNVLDINLLNSSQGDSPFAEDENKQPTLIDILFPPPGSEYDHQSKDFKSVEKVSVTTTIQEATVDVVEEEAENLFVIGKHSAQSLVELNRKTQEKLERGKDTFAHLKAIIDSLAKQHSLKLDEEQS